MAIPLLIAGGATAARVALPRAVPWLVRIMGRAGTAARTMEPAARTGAVIAGSTGAGAVLGGAAAGLGAVATVIGIAGIVIATGLVAWGIYKSFQKENEASSSESREHEGPTIQPSLQPELSLAPALATPAPVMMATAPAPGPVSQPAYLGPMLTAPALQQTVPAGSPWAEKLASAPAATHVEAVAQPAQPVEAQR